RHVLERPLLADLAVVGDPVDIDRFPPDVAPAGRDPEHVAGLGGGADESQRDEVAARDDVLLLGPDVRQRTDEGAEQSNDAVHAAHLSDGRAVPGGIRGEKGPPPPCVRAVEDLRHEPPGNLDPLVDRQCLTHSSASFFLDDTSLAEGVRYGILETPSPGPSTRVQSLRRNGPARLRSGCGHEDAWTAGARS